jgi:hypothetical protein
MLMHSCTLQSPTFCIFCSTPLASYPRQYSQLTSATHALAHGCTTMQQKHKPISSPPNTHPHTSACPHCSKTQACINTHNHVHKHAHTSYKHRLIGASRYIHTHRITPATIYIHTHTITPVTIYIHTHTITPATIYIHTHLRPYTYIHIGSHLRPCVHSTVKDAIHVNHACMSFAASCGIRT